MTPERWQLVRGTRQWIFQDQQLYVRRRGCDLADRELAGQKRLAESYRAKADQHRIGTARAHIIHEVEPCVHQSWSGIDDLT
jgi:hypothetical protein